MDRIEWQQAIQSWFRLHGILAFDNSGFLLKLKSLDYIDRDI